MEYSTARTRLPRENMENSLVAKIESLKQNAFTLLQEARELGSLSFADLRDGIDLYNEVRRFEIRLIKRALAETDGNQLRAAQLLGINNTTLHEKIRRFGIDPHDVDEKSFL